MRGRGHLQEDSFHSKTAQTANGEGDKTVEQNTWLSLLLASRAQIFKVGFYWTF